MDWLRKKYSINDLSKSLQRVKKQMSCTEIG